MTGMKKRVDTQVSEDMHTRWSNFLFAKHGTVKGPYGPELELAMKNHMRNYDITSINNDENIHNKTTTDKLKSICSGFKQNPKFPKFQPIVLIAMIKKYSGLKDKRMIRKYQNIVLSHSKEEQLPDETFPQVNVDGFCIFVDKLVQENLLK